jgi:heme/copper-type cytochrome/quinol oxidase subunit 4
MADTDLTGAKVQEASDKREKIKSLVIKVAIIVVVVVATIWLIKKFVR